MWAKQVNIRIQISSHMVRTLLLAALIAVMVLPACVSASPELTSARVLPSSGTVGDTFTFTVHYSGGSPVTVWLYIEGTPTQMEEVDPADLNTTDGKDYFVRTDLAEGTSVYYFKAVLDSGEEARTASSVIGVSGPEGLRVDHIDVVVAVLLFMVPAVWGLLMLRRLSSDIRETLELLRGRKKSE